MRALLYCRAHSKRDAKKTPRECRENDEKRGSNDRRHWPLRRRSNRGCRWSHSVRTSASVADSAPPPVPVVVGSVTSEDFPVTYEGIGTVQAFNTVTIRARVDGTLQEVRFKEGQDVKAGDVLAVIDPRPFQAALDQAVANKAKDEAQLANAKLDLKRFVDLRDFASKQSVDTQGTMVAQLEAAVKSDEAMIENATVQLGYTTIASPINGRTGVRLIDAGNIIHAAEGQHFSSSRKSSRSL